MNIMQIIEMIIKTNPDLLPRLLINLLPTLLRTLADALEKNPDILKNLVEQHDKAN